MLPLYLNIDGHRVRIKYDQLRHISAIKTIKVPDHKENQGSVKIELNITMDKKSKKSKERLVPMPQFLINNPSISIIPSNISSQSPTSSIKQLTSTNTNKTLSPILPKQSPVSTVTRVPPISLPAASLSHVSCEHIYNQEQSCSKSTDNQEIKSATKRSASNELHYKPEKVSRLLSIVRRSKESSTKVHLKSPDKKYNQVKGNQIKKIDSYLSKNLNAATSIPSTSSSINRVSQEPTSSHISKLPTNTDINCKADSTNVDVEKVQSRKTEIICILPDGGHIRGDKETNCDKSPLEYRINDVLLKFDSASDNAKYIKQVLDNALKVILKKDSLEFIRSKIDVPEDNLKLLSKSPTNQAGIKSPRTSTNQQQPNIMKKQSAVVLTSCSKQQASNSSILPSNIQQPSTKQDDSKIYVSSNQQTTSVKQSTTIQTFNSKQAAPSPSTIQATAIQTSGSIQATAIQTSVSKQAAAIQTFGSKQAAAIQTSGPKQSTAIQTSDSKQAAAIQTSVSKQAAAIQISGSKQAATVQTCISSKQAATVQTCISSKQAATVQTCISSKQAATVQTSSSPKQATTIPTFSSSKQTTTSSNLTSSIQQPIKLNDTKNYVSINQHSTSVKQPMATVTQIPPINIHLITNQQSTSSKHMAATPPSTKQSTTDVKRCTKCKSLSDDYVCATCRMSSHLKNVTVTRIKTPVTQSTDNSKSLKDNNIESGDESSIESREDSSFESVEEGNSFETSNNHGIELSDEDDDDSEDDNSIKLAGDNGIELTDDNVIESTDNKNGTQIEDDVHVISSDDEEDDSEKTTKKSKEPIISKVESNEQIKKYLEKLSANPKLLEDKFWQKSFITGKDYFKFDQCHTVQIGNYITSPVPSSNDLLICMHGIRMTVLNIEDQPVTIDVQIENIVKILGYYIDQPTLFIYTNYLAAVGIQHLLNMKESNKNYFFDPLSKDHKQKTIVWSFDVKKSEVSKLENFLSKLPKEKYEKLTVHEVNEILKKSTYKDGENTKRNTPETVKPTDSENSLVYYHKIDDRPITPIKICDYKMLSADEFVNDILIEFYMSYVYMRKLSDDNKKRTYVFNTFFYTQLAKPLDLPPPNSSRASARHERVKKWTKNVNIFDNDFIFIPINENFHWFMAVICYPLLDGPKTMEDGTPIQLDDEDAKEPHPWIDISNSDRDEVDGNYENLWNFTVDYNIKCGVSYQNDVDRVRKSGRPLVKQPCILIFDSLSGGISRSRIVATLREWLVEEYRSQYNGAVRDFSRHVMKGSLVKVPQQPNYSDCGLFVMHYFEKFFDHPIVDYTFPILHLENWFSTDEVSKDAEKRREVQNAIIQLREENGYHSLPKVADLPNLRFTSKPSSKSPNPNSPNTCNPTSTCDPSSSSNNTFNFSIIHKPNPNSPAIKQRGSQSYSQYQNQRFYNDHAEEIISSSIKGRNRDAEDEEEYVDEEEIDEEVEEEENVEDLEDDYSGRYDDDGEYNSRFEEDEYPEVEDQREYYAEMGDHNWSEGGQQDNDENFEQDYNAEELNRFHRVHSNNGNIVVDIDDPQAVGLPRNRINHLNISSLRAYRFNHRSHRHNIDHGVDVEDIDENLEDDNDDDDDDEPSQSMNHSLRQNRRR